MLKPKLPLLYVTYCSKTHVIQLFNIYVILIVFFLESHTLSC